MHDVTEGGLATALRELAAATAAASSCTATASRVSPETRRVCALLGADALGLIASGSLLDLLRPGRGGGPGRDARGGRHPATDIGELTEEDAGVVALERDRPAPWPSFDVDEAARLLARPPAARKTG